MNYLHNFTLNNVKQPIIHRDLKPSNLLVNSLDADSNAVTVKLTDFGISAIDAKTETSSSGTTAYMAPEVQERGESVTKSDVYSFGIVLWEMLTQAVPPTVKRIAYVLRSSEVIILTKVTVTSTQGVSPRIHSPSMRLRN